MKNEITIKIKTVKAQHNDCTGCILENTSCSEMSSIFIKAGLVDCTVADIIYQEVENDNKRK